MIVMGIFFFLIELDEKKIRKYLNTKNMILHQGLCFLCVKRQDSLLHIGHAVTSDIILCAYNFK